jgi:hypothetical protein
MIALLAVLLLTAIATEATVEVFLKGKIFDTPRIIVYKFFKEESFFGKLIRCPYCLSFWISAILLVLWLLFHKVWLVYCCWMAVQRISNVLNDIFDKIYYGQYGAQGVVFNDKKET